MAGYVHPEALVSTDWLAAHLNDADLRIVDATYHLPTVKRDPRAEYAAEHIPGAVFFDIDGISDRSSPLPHMLPNGPTFVEAMDALGIGDGDFVVAYDTYGLASAARAWWMLRIFGHDRVAVLDGGLPKWKREGKPVDGVKVSPPRRKFTPRFRPELVRAKANVMANLKSPNLKSQGEQVLDARSAGRFRGTDPEPRPGLRGGHIPGSLNLPANSVIDPQSLTLLPADTLRARFTGAGLDLGQPIVASCGSGVSACTLALGLHLVGAEKVAIYDGSWSEWGLPGDTPVETK